MGLNGMVDLQLSLDWFGAECEEAGKRISTSKPKTKVLGWKRVEFPLQVGSLEVSSGISGSYSQVRE